MQQLQGKLPSKYLAYFALNSNKKKPLVITKYLMYETVAEPFTQLKYIPVTL